MGNRRGTLETQPVGVAGHIIKRPRLTKILDESDARIILLCAPAGYGKTTLAREWVATRNEPVLWYSGGPAMADVAALAVDLAELVDHENVELIDHVRALATRRRPRPIAQAIASAWPRQPNFLVLDDYQYALGRADADSMVAELLRLIPSKVLIASRLRPSWITARSAVYGQALVLGQGALAFTRDETARVLQGRPDQWEQTLGWPAAVGLAAFSDLPAEGTAHLAPETFYEFVATELLAATDTELRRALFVLAAGGDTSADVARACLGPQWEAFAEAARLRGFATGTESGWIAMHPLLRRFLLRRMSELPRDDRERLMSGVLHVLASRHHWDACLMLLREYEDPKPISDVLRQALVELLAAGRTDTVADWADLGLRANAADPIFLLASAEVMVRKGDDRAAITLAEEAAEALDADLAARAHIVAARAAHQLDEGDTAARHARAAEHIASEPSLRTEALWLRFANAYDRSPETLQDAFEQLCGAPDSGPRFALRIASAEAFLYLGPQGNLHRALQAADRALALARTMRDPIFRTNVLNVRCQLLRLRARYDECLDAVPELLREADDTGFEFVVDHALLAQAGALIGIRALGETRVILRGFAKRSGRLTEHLEGNALLMSARLKIATGDVEGAAVLLAVDAPTWPLLLQNELIAIRASVCAAMGDADAASEALTQLSESATYVEPATIALLAKSILDTDRVARPERAAAAVAEALDLGCCDAVVTVLRAAPRLAALAVQGGAGPRLRQLLSDSHDADLGRHAGLSMPREYRRQVGLSPREREVYELLVHGRTNKEIASALFISQSTAKVHVKHIFEKLGVRTRAEAAARFRDS